MAIDRNSNGFTFIFAIIMVVVVGAALSFASMSLKPLQVENKIKKDMMSILGSVGVNADRKNAEEKFYSIITQRLTIDYNGEVIETREGTVDAGDELDPFNINVQKEYRDRNITAQNSHYPIYVADLEGQKIIVIPMVGKGLWGPIWGFVSLEGDYNTIYGASFDHAGETPGLGAEITMPFFEDPFKGKTIHNEAGELVSIDVRKGGAPPEAPHAVDAITGGTITSNGVAEMLERSFEVYDKYFEKNKTQTSQLQ